MELFKHQQDALDQTALLHRVAYYHDMGLGKTFTGAEKMYQLGTKVNLVICQKSKVDDWCDHFRTHYPGYKIYNFTDNSKENKRQLEYGFWINYHNNSTFPSVLVINYDLVFRRPELKKLKNFTLMLDESSLIQNRKAKRSKFILSLNPDNVILLSGTPTGGKYENLWSQMQLLGWKISESMFFNQYVDFHYDERQGFPVMIVDGYKNEERLKRKMREHGCHFLKTDEVFDLPEQIEQTIKIDPSKEYLKFHKDGIVNVNGQDLIGDNILTRMLIERQLCGCYSSEKLEAFKDLVESTNDRIIVFYNFYAELRLMLELIDRPISIVNGECKKLNCYEESTNSITFIQYQAGAMGLNLQKANKIVYFTPPLSSELFEQSKKRIHRIGQKRACFYYYLKVKGSIEDQIYKNLAMRRDYTDQLFQEEQ